MYLNWIPRTSPSWFAVSIPGGSHQLMYLNWIPGTSPSWIAVSIPGGSHQPMYLSWILDPCIHSCWFPIRYVSTLDPNNKPILDPCINFRIIITSVSKQSPNKNPILDRRFNPNWFPSLMFLSWIPTKSPS
jgi:hypothetical protein